MTSPGASGSCAEPLLAAAGRDHDAPLRAQRTEHLQQVLVEIEAQDPQPEDHVALGRDEVGQAGGIGRPLHDHDRDLAPFRSPQHLDRHRVPDRVPVEVHHELPGVLRDLAVEVEHDVAHAQSGRVPRSVGLHVAEDHAPRLAQPEAGGQRRGDGLGHHADLAAPYAPRLAELVHDRAHDVAGRGEPDAFAASAPG
jgi:hypothetical protein